MSRLQDEVRRIVEADGVIARRDHPELAWAITELQRRGELVSLLPGVCSLPDRAGDFETRVLAVRARDADAVLVEGAAARLTYWPELRTDAVRAAAPGGRQGRRGITFCFRSIPPELVMVRNGVRVTTPALTTLDLCPTVGSTAIDEVLRRRATRLADLHEALTLTSGRRGNARRLAALLDSRDEPWSAAERLCHRILRERRVLGWRSNLPVLVDGHRYYLDVAFPAQKIAVEIDGRFHGTNIATFENDRVRQNALVLAGWLVLRFTWQMLQNDPDAVVMAIRSAQLSRSRQAS